MMTSSEDQQVADDPTGEARMPGLVADDSALSTQHSALATQHSALDEPDLDELERRLGVVFKDRAILRQALIHKSLTNELGQSGLASNERLEFLGDSIVGATVAEKLYRVFPDRDEGELTLLRSALVRASMLAAWARELDLGPLILMGRGDARGGGRDRDPLLASTFEAVVGAVFLDRGFRAARTLVQRFATREIKSWAEQPIPDAKSRLQQVSQAWSGVTPVYEVLEVSGLGHSPVFTVRVTAGGGIQATAEGRSKQGAQQAAAAHALDMIQAAIEAGHDGSAPGGASR
jgi:ribonuclease-3